ncbi:MAG: hypothetical protein GIKADHBN_02770 [Phycisphaerales bacterium]|nr:hypothetical protein [Phycisphaerales bacterium]
MSTPDTNPPAHPRTAPPARSRFAEQSRTAIVTGILCIVLIITLMQLWLLTATMNAFLGGDHAVAGPALGASLVCLVLNLGLLRYLYLLERPR